MSLLRGRLHFVATLATNSIGVVAVLGILFALITGHDYHPFVVLAACIYLLLRPLLSWVAVRNKTNVRKNVHHDG